MSDTLTVARITGTDPGPAVWSEGWLPDLDDFPELTEARAEYQRRMAAWQAAGEHRRAVEARIEADTEQRKAALCDAYARGEREPKASSNAAGEKLKDELADARAHANAALAAFIEHINACIALVIEHSDEWQAEIETFEGSVDAEIRALLTQAAALRVKHGRYARLAHWIERTVRGGEFPAQHFPYSEIAAPLSGDPQEEDERSQESFERSYAGGLDPERRASEAEARSIERGVLSSQRQQPITPTETVEVELSGLDDGDLVDWLMSCGGFDGNPKPSAAQVIAAAEDGDAEFAQRLMQAERVAGGDAVRQDLLDRLSEITNGKVRA